MSLKGTLKTTITSLQIKAAYTIATFKIQVLLNTPPNFDVYSYQTTNEMYAYRKWNVTAKFFNDAESNDPIMDAKLATWDAVNLKWTAIASPSWFGVNSATMGDLYIEFNQPPQPASGNT
jgi:hypothetical protein